MQGALGDRQQRAIQLRLGEQLIFQELYNFDVEYLHVRVTRIGRQWVWRSAKMAGAGWFHLRQDTNVDGCNAQVAGFLASRSSCRERHQPRDRSPVRRVQDFQCAGVYNTRCIQADQVVSQNAAAELCDRRVQQELALDTKTLEAVTDYLAQQRSLAVADRLNEDSQAARDLASERGRPSDSALSAAESAFGRTGSPTLRTAQPASGNCAGTVKTG